MKPTIKKLDFNTLLDSTEVTAPQAIAAGYEVRQIPVDEIGRYDDNRILTEADIAGLYEQLVNSDFNLIHPVVIYPDPRIDREYTLVCGERRHMCFMKAGRPTIVAIIRRDLTPQQIRELNLIENDQRLDEPLNSRGKRYKKYIDDFGVTQSEAARVFAKSASFISDLVNYYAFIDDFPLVRDLYKSGTGLTDRHVIKNLLVISKKSESAAKSLIAFGEANRCLNRAFTEAALDFDLHGDIELDCRNWLMGFKEEKDKAAAVRAEKKASKKIPKKEHSEQEDSAGENQSKDEEQLEFSELQTGGSLELSETTDELPGTAESNVDAEIHPQSDNSATRDEVTPESTGAKKPKFKSRPLTEAEVMVDYQGANYYLDLNRVANDESKILLRNLAGDFFEVDPAAVTISYVH